MPKVTLTPHGIKAARASGMNRNPPKRGPSKGWTAGAARRNRDFLKSIDPAALSGNAVSASLTLGRDTVLTPSDMQAMRERFFDRLRYEGVTRHHWVMEFQRDGTPHLHMMIYFPDSHTRPTQAVLWHWTEVADHTGASVQGQHVVPVHALSGWLQYLAKHGARSAEHYQRSTPSGWENPGRMWGKSGEWPTLEEAFEIDRGSFYALRRWVRNWRLADARRALDKATLWADPVGQAIARRRIVSARSLLNRGDRCRSELMGFDEWAGPSVVVPMRELLSGRPGALLRDWSERDQVPTQPPLTEDVKDRREGGA